MPTTDWILAGGLVDFALACLVLEAIVLLSLRRRWMKASRPAGVAANLVAGAMLLLALRAAIADSHWSVIAACLSAALIAHATDIGLRLGLLHGSVRKPPSPDPRKDG